MTLYHPHPLLGQIGASAEQRPPIEARGCDVAVTAGAGAGKTRTLVARYLALLVEGVPLRSIVAITFTKKAAREMRNRVRQELRRYLERQDLTREERERWEARYMRLDAARIGTLHNLCAEILRRHPAEAGIDPRFEMVDEGEMALLQARAVDAALAWTVDDAECARLFLHFGERELRRMIARLLDLRLDVEEVRFSTPAARWEAWQARLATPIRAFAEDPLVRDAFAGLCALREDGTLERAAAAADKLVPYLREALVCWDAIEAARREGDWAAASVHLAPLRESLKQYGRKGNWAPADPKALIKALQELYDEQLKSVVGKGIDLRVDRELALVWVPALLRLFERALEHYRRAKRERQGLDFDDLELGALRLLESHPEVCEHWRATVNALLVDEFQDTNGRQRDLLARLNGDQGKLFIVGDGKQSIYRFRGAEVAVFRQTRREIAAGGRAFELATSYRAHRALLEALNALLKPVLGEEEDPERPYVEPFARLEPHRESPAAGLVLPYVELRLALGSKSDGALLQAARILAARLVTLVEREDIRVEERDPDTGEPCARPLDYGDVAILCRASTSFAAYEQALEEARIPFLTVSGRGFYDRPEVRDLLNALQALADPTDDLALAGLLRSPACGLSDAALYYLCRARPSGAVGGLWAALGAEDLAPLGDEAAGARAVRALVERLHAQVGRVPVAGVLKAFLDATDYRVVLLKAGLSRAVDNVTKLLGAVQTQGIVGVSAFVEHVDELRDVGTREGEAHSLATGAVQIMSVHQAKGLEFPVVVIGDVTRDSPSTRGLLLDEELGVVPPFTAERQLPDGDEAEEVRSAAHQLARQREGEEEDAESRRLLYVAATRARECLILSGALQIYKSGRLGPRGWLADLEAALDLKGQAPGCDGEGDQTYTFTVEVQGVPVHCALHEPQAPVPEIKAAVPGASASSPPHDEALLQPLIAPEESVDEEVATAEREPPRRVWRVVPEGRATAPPWVVGQLVHLALAQWLFPDEGRLDFPAWAAAEARSSGLTDDVEVRDAAGRASRMLTRFRVTDLWEEMANADRRLHEIPYTLLTEDGGVESGVIDALFCRGERWTLVEFKSDHVPGRAALEALLEKEDYVPQVARYLRAVERLLGVQPRPLLCLLNYDGSVRLVDDRWD
ncbi:MAG: UvrD-helicase domain-containing protein [Anaerolineales bacterium]